MADMRCMIEQMESNSKIKRPPFHFFFYNIRCRSIHLNLLRVSDPSVRDDVRCFALGTVYGTELVSGRKNGQDQASEI